MSWNKMQIKDQGKYLKVKAGETAHIHILSRKPQEKYIHWVNNEKFDCSGTACKVCARSEYPTQKFLSNVYDRKAKMMKVYEFGAGVANQIREIAKVLAEDGGTIHDFDFKISVRGSGKDTRYTVVQVAKSGKCPVPYLDGFDAMDKAKDLEPAAEDLQAEEPPLDDSSVSF